MKKFYFFYKIGKAAGNILMKYKVKDVLDDQILKTWNSAEEKEEIFSQFSEGYLHFSYTHVTWNYQSGPPKFLKQYFLFWFSACSSTYRVHTWAHTASRSCWFAPREYCQFYSGCLAWFSEVLAWYTYKQSQCIHSRGHRQVTQK